VKAEIFEKRHFAALQRPDHADRSFADAVFGKTDPARREDAFE
jgi:hypothetical protein